MSCSAATTVRPSACQCFTSAKRSPEVRLVDGVEGLVEHDQARVLQHHPREQQALQLPAGERADRAVLEAGETHGGERLVDLLALRLADAAEEAGRAPEPGADEIEHRDRKAAVDVGGLRQIGDIARVEAAERDRARQRLEDADQAAKQRRLAGAVRADHGEQRAGCDFAGEMMHRRVAVIAERDVAEIAICAAMAHLIASHTTAQSPALTASAAPSLETAGMRRIDQVAACAGCGAAGPWLWPWWWAWP